MRSDPRFTQGTGTGIFTGNELLVKGALEAEGGVHLLTGYPGSPIAPFFDCVTALSPLLEAHGIVGRMAVNEAISVAMVNGAQMAGCRAITAFKSVGMHVAADALAIGVLSGTQGDSGALIVVGDDPWSDSTQVPADSRFLAEHVRLPLIEPCCPQEVKDWVGAAFQIGRAGQIYIGYLMTVANADGGGTVQCRPNCYPSFNARQQKVLSYEKDIEPVLEQTVLLPPRTWQREIQLRNRFEAVKDAARQYRVNHVLYGPQKGEKVPLAFVGCGSAHAYLVHALSELDLLGRLPILRMGMSYPVDDQLVIELASQCEQLIVIEERRGFVERQVRQILDPLRQRGELNTQVYGKHFPGDLPGVPETRGLNPSVLMERLIPLFRAHPTLPIELTNGNLTRHLDRIQATASYETSLPSRTPTFCPGCPHRDSSSVLLEIRRDLLDSDYMDRVHKRRCVDLVAHGDTGCYTMLMFEPNKSLMHNYSGMGLGGGTGAGVDPFIENKQIVFMGDGTFHHSGQIAIGQSIYIGQDITYIILDNKTTAMTGHQHTFGSEADLMGQVANPLDIERIVKGMVPRKQSRDVRIVRINPADRMRYRKLMEQTILADGVKIVIADKECGITYHRRGRKQEQQLVEQFGFLPKKTHMNIATEVCEFCLECTTRTGCPGLKFVDTDYGPKMQTDMSWCVNDGACHRIGACPAFEEMTVYRHRPQRMSDEHVALDDLPSPTPPIHAEQDTWRCYLAGVGGMGIGLCTALLVTAGHEMGYHVQFLDKKGLAIRNGGVFSQLVFMQSDKEAKVTAEGGSMPKVVAGAAGSGVPSVVTTPLVPYGKADLLLGIDLVEAVRGIDPSQPYRVASPEHTAAVINTAKTPTILTLMGRDDFAVDDLERTLARYTKPEHSFSFNIGDLCERVLDTKLYANIMMLGIAFQKGYLPLTGEAIEKAIGIVCRDEADRNLRAFKIGRKIAVQPELFVVEMQHEYESARRALRRKINTIRAWWGAGPSGRFRGRGEFVARQYRVLMKQTFRQTRGLCVPDALMRDVIIRAYDCLVWGGIKYAKRYCHRLVEVFHKDHPEHGYAITHAVVWNLAKVMLIKDEVYVSAMLTSPEKYRRDRRRYNVNLERGDRVVYRHHNRPEFDVFGRKIQFEWKSRDWQLRLMSGCGFLRSLMPAWHRHERQFCQWYERLVDRLDWHGANDYQRWLAILSTPETVRGFRGSEAGNRYAKQDTAQRLAETFLDMDPADFDPAQRHAVDRQRAVELPVIS